MSPPNAFELVRPAALPPPPLGEGRGGGQRPANPRRVNLAPRANSFHIVGAEQAQAHALKTEQIGRGTLGARAQRKA